MNAMDWQYTQLGFGYIDTAVSSRVDDVINCCARSISLRSGILFNHSKEKELYLT